MIVENWKRFRPISSWCQRQVGWVGIATEIQYSATTTFPPSRPPPPPPPNSHLNSHITIAKKTHFLQLQKHTKTAHTTQTHIKIHIEIKRKMHTIYLFFWNKQSTRQSANWRCFGRVWKGSLGQNKVSAALFVFLSFFLESKCDTSLYSLLDLKLQTGWICFCFFY